MKYFFLIILLCIFSCKESPKALTAQEIIDNTIEVHCGGNCENATMIFAFRGKSYKSIKNKGLYHYERIQRKGDTLIRDILSNNGFQRFINDSLFEIPNAIATKYANSVNSVHYFAQLPYGLNAAAVKKVLFGESEIKGKLYYKIGVSFNEEGGGTDFEDKFVYWISKDDFSMDYLAYSYAVNGGGIRFREAYNKRIVNGITFLDYNNYKPDSLNIDLTDLDDLFIAKKLKLISKIELDNVQVHIN
ncbi:MAG: DUF6503 family protein [Jejuia sp.]